MYGCMADKSNQISQRAKIFCLLRCKDTQSGRSEYVGA